MAALAALALLAGMRSDAAAQVTTAGPVAVDPSISRPPDLGLPDGPSDDAQRASGQGITPLVAPIPFRNTQVGWGLFLLAGAIHRFDPDTTLKPSIGAVGGFYSENGSWGLMALEMARLGGDAWRLRGLVSHMSLRYDFYGIGEEAGEAGQSVRVQQEMDVAAGSALRRVRPGLYVGPTAIWIGTRANLRDPPQTAQPPAAEDLARADLVAPGLQAEFDTRNDDYWPGTGSIARLKATFFSEPLGSSRSFQRYFAIWSWYTALPAERLILATNVNAAAAAGDAPFYALPTVGTGQGGLRGYTQGRYRDRVMTTAQVELRYHLKNRFGATAFGGIGQVAPDGAGILEAQALPAGGLGLRYQLTQQFPMHMRFDYAWGRDGGLFYFAVAEAF